MDIVLLRAEMFRPITQVKLKLVLMSFWGPAQDPNKVHFIGHVNIKSLGWYVSQQQHKDIIWFNRLFLFIWVFCL